MIEKTVKALVESAEEHLKGIKASIRDDAKRADEVVERCKEMVAGVVKLSEDVRGAFGERYKSILATTFRVENQQQYTRDYARFEFNGYHAQLDGISGQEKLEPGRYRAIVLLERLGPLESGR